MQSITIVEQAILEKIRSLSLEKQQEILDFAEFLVQKTQIQAKHQWSPEFLSTFDAWEGELTRELQGEQLERESTDHSQCC
jgi:hypothetical protein